MAESFLNIECEREKTANENRTIDVSNYQPKNTPSLTWRERIKKIWKENPLIYPECAHKMKIILFIMDSSIVEKIFKYLDL